VTQADVEAARVKAAEELDELKIRLQAERAADLTIGAYELWKSKEPERQAQLVKDRQTFIDTSNTLRSFSVNEANFSVIRSTLGEGFTVYGISQGILSNALILAPPTQQQINEWAEQDREAHNQRLLSASPQVLRQAVKSEAEQRRAQSVLETQAEADRAHQVRDAARMYPPLPNERNGKPLNAKFIKAADRTELRFLIQRYGETQVTNRLRGLA
jgi:hypothetical protein